MNDPDAFSNPVKVSIVVCIGVPGTKPCARPAGKVTVMTEFRAPSVEILVYGRYAVEFVYTPPRRRTEYDVNKTCPFTPVVARASYVNEVVGVPVLDLIIKNPSARSAFRCWFESPTIEII
jgi:hypothetical protein